MNSKKKIVFIVGPTAVGKSRVGIILAKKIKGEIVSCDSMQVYKEVTIASAKPSKSQMKEVPHHLIGQISVKQDFDVVLFSRMALSAIADITARSKIPVLVGGSGMYVKALLDGIFKDGLKDELLRFELKQRADKEGLDKLFNELKKADPKAAEKIHPNDERRIIRALEVCRRTNKVFSDLQQEKDGIWGKYKIYLFGLNLDRKCLYDEINARVDRMFEGGLVDEFKGLKNLSLSKTVKGLIGIKELAGFFNGEYDVERAKYLIKRNTRHFAKRQLTWFRKEERLTWVEIKPGQTPEDTAEIIYKVIK